MTDAHVTIANIKRFELLLRTPLTETQRLTVEILLGEALEKVGWLQPDPLPAGTTRRSPRRDDHCRKEPHRGRKFGRASRDGMSSARAVL